jgi:mitotic spindle assembly checkpoint protein MAD1
LHQKTEVEKKLATFSSQEASSTGSNVLVKQLQQELQHYVSFIRLLS